MHTVTPFLSNEFAPGLVSIIIPVLNRKDLIYTAIQSCFDQSYDCVEVIAVDDGSTDGTIEVLTRLESESEPGKFRWLKNKGKGASAARNQGLVASKGEFIQFLDSDDTLHPDKLQLDLEELRGCEEVELVYSKVQYVNALGHQTQPPAGTALSMANLQDALSKNCWHTIAPLYRRRLCARIGPWAEELIWAEDLEYAARIKARQTRLKFCDRISGFARVDTADKRERKLTFEQPQGQEKYMDYALEYASSCNCLSPVVQSDMRAYLSNAAIKYSLLGKRAEFERCLSKACRLGSFRNNIGRWAALCLSKLVGCRNAGLAVRWVGKNLTFLKTALNGAQLRNCEDTNQGDG